MFTYTPEEGAILRDRFRPPAQFLPAAQLFTSLLFLLLCRATAGFFASL